MLTYQLHERHFNWSDAPWPHIQTAQFTFPNEAEMQVTLAPGAPFGVADNIRHWSVPVGAAATVGFDPNSGDSWIDSAAPSTPVEVDRPAEKRLVAAGNSISLITDVSSQEELEEHVRALHFLYPLLLGAESVDTPYVTRTSGRVGDVRFGWEIRRFGYRGMVISTEWQEGCVTTAFDRLQLFARDENRRVAAALFYFHRACRLTRAGHGPFEFLSEVILGYTKSLQAAFGESMDKVRTGLRGLGYTTDSIETMFIPVMLLRDSFDSAHVSLAVHQQEDLQTIYAYLSDLEAEFRSLMQRILESIAAGRGVVPPDPPDMALHGGQRRKMDGLLRSIRARPQRGVS